MRDRSVLSLCWRAAGVLLLVALTSAPALAAASWNASLSRGTVFVLVGDKWEELLKGQALSGDQVIRTLQSGRLQLDGPEGRLELGSGTAIQIEGSRVTQFSGTMTASIVPGSPLTVAADDVVVTINGKAMLRFEGGEVSVKVISGTAAIADASHGQGVVLVAGQSAEASGAGIVSASLGNAAAPASAHGGNPNANAAASSSNGSSAGSNSSANSNAGGNGNGNGGGNENSNAGGNGNGNGGGNGNGNGNGG